MNEEHAKIKCVKMLMRIPEHLKLRMDSIKAQKGIPYTVMMQRAIKAWLENSEKEER